MFAVCGIWSWTSLKVIGNASIRYATKLFFSSIILLLYCLHCMLLTSIALGIVLLCRGASKMRQKYINEKHSQRWNNPANISSAYDANRRPRENRYEHDSGSSSKQKIYRAHYAAPQCASPTNSVVQTEQSVVCVCVCVCVRTITSELKWQWEMMFTNSASSGEVCGWVRD